MVRTGSASVAAGPTLAVVAREAGVSVPTASKVVNGREDVAPETRRRVTEALDRLGYVRRPRVAGYRSALASAGVRHRPEYVRHAGFDETVAHRRMLDLLDLPEPP